MIIVHKGVLPLLKVQEIRELIKLIDESTIDEFKYEYEGSKITMKKAGKLEQSLQSTPVTHVVQEQPVASASQPAQPAAKTQPAVEEKQPVAPVEEDTNLHKIESPMVGTFYAAPTPDADTFVSVGSKVTPDHVVCIVEAMKLFNEIEADVKGEIVEVLVENGQLVEYGQPLFLVKTE